MFTMIVYSKNKLHEIDYFLIILRQNYIIFLNKNDLLLFSLYYFLFLKIKIYKEKIWTVISFQLRQIF